jgi:hypothetical protein
MNIPNRIAEYIDECFKEEDKRNFQYISIEIKESKISFLIMDSKKLFLGINEDFALVIYFRYNITTRKGQALSKKIYKQVVFKVFKKVNPRIV